jgi:hypothetical protein
VIESAVAISIARQRWCAGVVATSQILEVAQFLALTVSPLWARVVTVGTDGTTKGKIMNMTLSDLIEQLTDLADEVGGDAEVRLAIQPNYPFEHGLGEPVVVDGVVYIPETGQRGYLDGAVSEELGWRG